MSTLFTTACCIAAFVVGTIIGYDMRVSSVKHQACVNAGYATYMKIAGQWNGVCVPGVQFPPKEKQ